MADALDRWDEEGGAPAVPWPVTYGPATAGRGASRPGMSRPALVSEWNDLPTDVQRRLFEHATSGKSR